MGFYSPVLGDIYGVLFLTCFMLLLIGTIVYDLRQNENPHDYKGLSMLSVSACLSLGLIIVIARKIPNNWSKQSTSFTIPI